MKVTLTVSNGSGATNQATDVSARLNSLGYTDLDRRRHGQGSRPRRSSATPPA